MTLERAPEFPKVLDAAFAKALAAVSVAMPAKVTSANVSAQVPTVDVETCLGRTIIEEGREVDEKTVQIAGVPLVFPGSGSYRLTFPIAAGDYVLLVVADRSTDEFVQRGGTNIPVHLHTHDITDCFAIPGVIAPPQQLSNVATGVMVLGKNGNPHKPAARKDDGAGGGSIAVVHVPASGPGVVPCTLQFTYTPGDGSGVQVLAAPSGSGTLNIKEKITAGSSDVEIT